MTSFTSNNKYLHCTERNVNLLCIVYHILLLLINRNTNTITKVGLILVYLERSGLELIPVIRQTDSSQV